jgi:hypothetical protein
MPGYLIPADLERMIPAGADPLEWAETNLLASPGATVIKDGVMFRIPTLVPASKADGSCIHFRQRRCAIWETSPFGCAFFGCTPSPDQERLAQQGLKSVYEACRNPEPTLYARIWEHLWLSGRQSEAPDEKRARMEA